VTADEQAGFFDSLTHSAAVVGINTTAMIEAAIVGKSVLTILDQEFAQESTLHFHYLLQENGGFLRVASSLAEHATQLSRVLEGDGQAEGRARFIESFVRPYGLDRPATPILADEVERLAGAPVDAAEHARWSRARLMLILDVPLSSIALVAFSARRWLRGLRRRAPTRAS
jgi:hypothetical protein